jgi:hypothetical protein
VGVLAQRFGYGQLIRFGLLRLAAGGRRGRLRRIFMAVRVAVRGHLRLRAGLDHSGG